jgi:hypothetical protein
VDNGEASGTFNQFTVEYVCNAFFILHQSSSFTTVHPAGTNGTLKRIFFGYKLHQKQAAYVMLLERTTAGVLSRGVSEEVSSLTKIHVHILVNWCKKCKTLGLDGLESKGGNSGRKKIPFDPEAITHVDLSKRTTLHDLAIELNMSVSTLWCRLNEGLFRRHTNAIKSTLTDGNKVALLRFCLSMLENIIDFEDSTFKEMYNVIHIDDKWFYRTHGSQNYTWPLEKRIHSVARKAKKLH